MPQINQLTAVDALNAGDQIPIYDASNGDARKSSLTLLTSFLQSALTFGTFAPLLYTQYSTPLTGATVAISPSTVSNPTGAESVHLIITPAGTLFTLTLTLPVDATSVDGQIVVVNCTQIVTSLTVSVDSGTVVGAPTLFSSNDFFTMKLDKASKVWYRVG